MSTCFVTELRGVAGIHVKATIYSMAPPTFDFELTSPDGHALAWELTRAELTQLARTAALVARNRPH